MAISAPVVDGKLEYEYTDNSKNNGINPTGSTLGYDQFLQLLCAEMQYQDPLEPTSNTEYVAQMATFSQLEATLSLAEMQESQRASDLVGKQVILKVVSETTGNVSHVAGRVDYVMYENGETYLSVNDGLYPLSSLDTVADAEYYEGVTLATTLKDMVNALPLMENLTLEYRKAITQLREIYDGMTSYQQQFVPEETLTTLKEYEVKMEEIVKQAESSAAALKDRVDALPLMEDLTLEHQEAIAQIREIYDGMTSHQQQFVPEETLTTLKEYEAKMEELVKQAESSTEDTPSDETPSEESGNGSGEETATV